MREDCWHAVFQDTLKSDEGHLADAKLPIRSDPTERSGFLLSHSVSSFEIFEGLKRYRESN